MRETTNERRCYTPTAPKIPPNQLVGQSLLKMGSDVPSLASLPTTSTQLSHRSSPFSDKSGEESTSSVSRKRSNASGEPRRRRTGEVANPANTLDGLVARREAAGGGTDPIRRYLSEHDAIESPCDDVEIKRMETDPDVSTRTCSICGYQGKWVSEMIRHKRVHTNDRPFKCKYCSRTSKWKADLIRHVAKTHGIRVVSKYSRSKALDANSPTMRALKNGQPVEDLESFMVNNGAGEQNDENQSDDAVQQTPPPAPIVRKLPSPPLKKKTKICGGGAKPAPIGFRCLSCLFEQESHEVLIAHLTNVHDQAPYECRSCNANFANSDSALNHYAFGAGSCLPSSLSINVTPIYRDEVIVEVKKPAPLQIVPELLTNDHSPASAAISNSDCQSDRSSSAMETDMNTENEFLCPVCPYKTEIPEAFNTHCQGHLLPKGFLNYKCAFCCWFHKKKATIVEHMMLHTTDPEQYIAEVEKNLVTPATVSKYESMVLDLTTINLDHQTDIKTNESIETKTEKHRYEEPKRSSFTSITTTDISNYAAKLISNSSQQHILLSPNCSPKPKKYVCTKCEAKFSDNTQLKRHIRFHGVQMKHQCPMCDYSVPFPINLVKHLKSHHSVAADAIRTMLGGVLQASLLGEVV